MIKNLNWVVARKAEFKELLIQAATFYNNSQGDALLLNFIVVKNFTRFGQIYCPSSGVLILYSQQ